MTPPERDHIMKNQKTTQLRMRDLQPIGLQDLKDQAQRLRKLTKGSLDLKHTQALEMASKLQGFESWGQAKAHLEAIASSRTQIPETLAPLLSRRMIVEGGSALGKDILLRCGHAAFFLRHDEESQPLACVLEWAQAEVWQKPGCLYLPRPNWPGLIPTIPEARHVATTLSKRLGFQISESCEDLYDTVLDAFSRADLPKLPRKAPTVVSLPWMPGDERLVPALRERNVFAMLRVRRREVDQATKAQLDMLMEACEFWVLAPGITLPGMSDNLGRTLRNDDDYAIAFEAPEVRQLFADPDYKGEIREPLWPDEAYELEIALRVIRLM